MAYATDSRAHGASFGQRLTEFRAWVADRYARYAVYNETVRELAQLSDRDLADLGIHRSMIPDLAKETAYGSK